MRRPKDLYALWHEYESGQSDRTKPAKFFTPVEKGKNKFAYSKRKVI